MMNIRFYNIVKFFFVIASIGCLTSCIAVVDPAATNSASGIIAAIGEYLYAIIVLLLILVMWFGRVLGISTVILAAMAFTCDLELIVPPLYLLLVGVFMILVSFMPIKQYDPTLMITKSHKIVKHIMNRYQERPRSWWKDLLLQVAAGIIVSIVQYGFLAK